MDLTNSAAWQALEQHHEQFKDIHLKQLFEEDAERGTRYAVFMQITLRIW
jgi:glucose-6-phosphate isomerase